MNFYNIKTQGQFSDAVLQLGQHNQFAVDTETCVRKEWEGKGGSALDPHTGQLSLVIVKARNTLPYVFDWLCLESERVDPSPLIDVLESAEYQVFANGKFDWKFFYGTWGCDFRNLRDVMIMSQMLANATGSKAGKMRGHGYADLCRDFLNVRIEGKKTLRESTWNTGLESRNLNNDWWRDKLTYAANDVQYLFPLHDILEQAICTPLPDSPLIQSGNTSDKWGLGMGRALEREMAVIPIIAEMEYEGMPNCQTTMTRFQEQVCLELDAVAVYLSRELQLDTPLLDWEGREVPSPKAINMLRSSGGLLRVIQQALKLQKINNVQAHGLERMLQIIDLLLTDAEEVFVDDEEADLYSELTQMEQSDLVGRSPVVKAILQFKRLVKQEGMDLRKYINPATGRIHPNYSQLGAATSRCSASKPNSQQISAKTNLVVEINEGQLNGQTARNNLAV